MPTPTVSDVAGILSISNSSSAPKLAMLAVLGQDYSAPSANSRKHPVWKGNKFDNLTALCQHLADHEPAVFLQLCGVYVDMVGPGGSSAAQVRFSCGGRGVLCHTVHT